MNTLPFDCANIVNALLVLAVSSVLAACEADSSDSEPLVTGETLLFIADAAQNE